MGSFMPLEDRLAALPLASLVIFQVALSRLLWCRKIMTIWSELPLSQRAKLCHECPAVTGQGEDCRLIHVHRGWQLFRAGSMLFQGFSHV